jgi:uncharacterized membrane protein
MKDNSAAARRGAAADVCISGLLTALVFVATMFVNIRLPISINGGLIHLGNVPLVVASIVFGRKKGAIAGAVGMTLFDVLSGWALWAPGTFIVRGVMGYVIGLIAERRRGESFLFNTVAVIAGGAWMIAGYYLTEGIIYGNFVAPLTSIPGNLVQVLTALVIGMPLATAMKKQKLYKFK